MALHDLAIPPTSPLVALVDILKRSLPDRWRRARGRWTPTATMVALVHLVVSPKGYRPLCHHMGCELGNLFGDDRLHASAFAQARQRLGAKPELLADAFAAVYQQAATARRTRSMTYGAYTVIAVDGTHVPLQRTPDLLRYFGVPRNQHGASAAPQALVSVVWDVGANQPVDVAVAPSISGELTLSKTLLGRLPVNAVVVADRLYATRHVIADLITSRQHLLIRVPTGSNAMQEVQDFLATGQVDAEVELGCFSRIQPERYARHERVRVRLIRGHGDGQVYITSLTDRQEHPREALLALYTTRWRIETAFRELKIWTNLTTIRARRHQLVAQEIVAILIYALLLSELDAMALEAYREEIAREHQLRPTTAKPHGGKKPLQLRQNSVRFNRAVAITAIPGIIIAAIAGDPQKLQKTIAYAIDSLWAYRARVKPGRSYPRVSSRPHSKWNRLRERTSLTEHH